MIIYHPGYDVYHCSYRMLNVLCAVEGGSLLKETLKLIDFYYLYPHLLKRISALPKPLCYHKKIIDSIEDPFELISNPKALYFDLDKIQESAIAFLKYKSLLLIEGNIVSINKISLPEILNEKFESDDFCKQEIFGVLTRQFSKINLNGPNGFKARSGLMEYRYG